jgi:hypothetical protein
MERARPLESKRQGAGNRGAASAAPRSSPLTIVSGAVAGDDLASVAASASEALGRPVAIAIPALGTPVVWPAGALADDDLRKIAEFGARVVRGDDAERPTLIADAVPVRIGEELVGIVVAASGKPGGELTSDEHSWLEAGAAAAAVTALMREAQAGGIQDSRRALIRSLRAAPPSDLQSVLGHARRLGFDLSSGAVALCAVAPSGEIELDDLAAGQETLIAEVAPGRICALLPLASRGGAEELASSLSEHGLRVATSSPRGEPEALHEALREAELLVELGGPVDGALAGQDETYRLLIGVLLRNRRELEQLRSQTISALVAYDAQHDTELLSTLQAFFQHHGSTTETADAMNLHRHTVGYRLSRVHEVAGLSPYESDGRERLSLGLKAHEILETDLRLLGE